MTGSETKQTAQSPTDRFGQVLGAGRGLANAPATHEQLRAAEERLAEVEAVLRAGEEHAEELRVALEELQATLDGVRTEREQQGRLAKRAVANEAEAFMERDRARYAAMRSGLQDPCGHAGVGEAAYQGTWTPGRPYLAHQHAEHPKTYECYRACDTGAPPGEMPGTGRHWQRCMDPDTCPMGISRPMRPSRRQLSGDALRETKLRWRSDTPRAPRELSDEELGHVIGFLRVNAADICAEEWLYNHVLVPCPVNAFSSAAAWMADTPLMRALLRERRRRQRARSRPA